MNQNLIHDRAHAMAFDLLATVRNCLREEEWQDAFEEFYAITKAGLKQYDRQASRMRKLGGSTNRFDREGGEPTADGSRPEDSRPDASVEIPRAACR